MPRHIALGVAASAATGCAEIVLTLSPLAAGTATDGRYAVDIGRTLALYIVLGAAYGAIFALLTALIARVRPHAVASSASIGRGYAIHVGTWVFLAAIATRVVHGTTLLGAGAGAPSTFFVSATAVLAVCVGYVVAKRHDQFVNSPPRFRRAVSLIGAAVIASALGGLFSIRQSLDLESLIRREIDTIPTDTRARTAQAGRTNILLLTIDTLRADRLGAYGYAPARTPALDTLARQGVVFERAIAQSSWTRPSFGTLFTSRYPSDHRAAWRLLKNAPGDRHSLYNRPLRSDLPTVAEILDAGGYLTIGINTNVQTSRPFGFDHGFDHYVDVSRPLSVLTSSIACRSPGLGLSARCRRWSAVSPEYPYLTGDRVIEIFDAIADRLERSPRPFFLWLHLMDPHVPYRSHDGTGRSMGYDDIERLLAADNGDARAARETGAMYDAAVAFTDRCVGEAVARLDGSESLGPTAILVTSDHGEELVERWRTPTNRPEGLGYYYRGYGHGHTMYDELLRVPMILRLPESRHAGVRVSSLVGHVDVMPTLLALANVTSDNPRYRPEGIDLASLLGSAAEPARSLRSEAALYGSEVKALATGERKIVVRFADGERERYDLAADPREREAVGADGRAGFESTERELDDWLASLPAEPDEGSAGEAEAPSIDDAQLRQQLEALGYIQ